MKATGLLNNADLAEFKARGLSRITLGTDVGRIGRMEGGLRLTLSDDATPSPFDIVALEKSAERWTKVSVFPGVLIGCQGFVVPRFAGLPIIGGSSVPTITNPDNYLFLACSFVPAVVESQVDQVDLDPTDDGDGESCLIHWVAGAEMTDCNIVQAHALDDFDEDNFSGLSWSEADGIVPSGTRYIPFAGWNADELRYENLLSGLILNCRPDRDLINLGFAADQNTEAYMLFG